MKNAIVYMTIRCPTCERSTRIPYTRLEIADLLSSTKDFRIYSICHNTSWLATEDDRRNLFALIKPGDVRDDASTPPWAIERPSLRVD